MWFSSDADGSNWLAARRHLRKDPILRRIISRVGPCTLYRRRDYFVALCQAIFNQQLSMAVARVLFGRFRDLFPRRRPTPRAVLRILSDDACAKSCGLSKQKRAYLLDLARHFADGTIPTRRFA